MNDLTTDNNDRLDLLMIELRLLAVSGRDIGDALSGAREFLTDSGERAEDSFGSPQQYAAALGFPAEPTAQAVVGGVSLRS